MAKVITMIRTEKGSNNGVKVEEFKKGEEYTVDDNLARLFVEELKCAKYKEVSKVETPEDKKVETPEGSNKLETTGKTVEVKTA